MAESDSKAKGSTIEGQLDLSEVTNDDLDEIANTIEQFYTRDSTVKLRLSYNWSRNHLFLDGNQWLTYSENPETGGMWQRLQVSKSNEWIPRPVTNYIFDAYQTLKSYMLKNRPRCTVRPNTETFRDKASAQIANLCLEANWAKFCEDVNYEYAVACLIAYGTVFKKSYWDTTVGGMVSVPRMQTVPQTDPQTGQVMGEHQVPALDENGQPIIDQVPLGDVNTCVVEPQRIALDMNATAMHNLGWIMEYSIHPISWIKETYGREGDGYTGLAEEITEERALSGALRRFQQLKNSSGTRGSVIFGEGTATGGSVDTVPPNHAVVKEYYEKPSQKYPKGRLLVVANHKTLYAGDSPYSGPEHGDWHPYSECRWEVVPGRFWGKSPLDAACEIQRRLNSIDAVIVLNRKTMAIPQKRIPIGSGVAPGSWTGRPGQEIFYREISGAVPDVIPAAGVDPSVFQEREACISDLKAITGAIDILKGDRPPGVTAASALNLLYEVGTGKLYPGLTRYKLFVESDQKKQLKLICKKYQEPRPEYIAMLMQKNTELDPSSISKFIGSDLYDNCNVVVEAGSNIPKLQAAQQAALQEAANLGTLALEQPANRNEYNQRMGIQGFDNDVGPDTKRAEWENSQMDSIELSMDNRPILLEVDQDDIHIEVHTRFMKSPAFLQKSQAVQQAFMQHYVEHLQQQSRKMQQAMMEQMAHGMPTQAPPSAMASQEVKGHGKGLPKEQSNMLKTDALQGPPK
jgi:hypothetical protein